MANSRQWAEYRHLSQGYTDLQDGCVEKMGRFNSLGQPEKATGDSHTTLLDMLSPETRSEEKLITCWSVPALLVLRQHEADQCSAWNLSWKSAYRSEACVTRQTPHQDFGLASLTGLYIFLGNGIPINIIIDITQFTTIALGTYYIAWEAG